MGRHGEGDRAAVRAILQSCGLRGEAQILIAVHQPGREDDLFAGEDAVHLRRIVGTDFPGRDAFPAGDGEFLFQAFQLQYDDGFLLASGDRQSGIDGLSSVHTHLDRSLAAVKSNTRNGQAPAVRRILHAHEGPVFPCVSAANREQGILRRIFRFDDVGNITGISLIAVDEQTEGHAVFIGRLIHVIAHSSAVGRQIAQVAELRNAVLNGAVYLVEGRVEPGEHRFIDFGILLLYSGDHFVEIDLTGCADICGTAQNVGVLEGGLKHGGIVPLCCLDPPAVGAPVVQRDVHVDRGDGHLEFAMEGEYLPMVLDQFGLVFILISQHHIALIILYLVVGRRILVCVDRAAPVAVCAIANNDDVDARIISRDRFAVDDHVLQRQLCGDIALLQIFKQLLAFGAFARAQVVGIQGKIEQVVAGFVVGVLHGLRPHFLQRRLLHHAHGHVVVQGVQRPSLRPERAAELKGKEEQVDPRFTTELQVYAHIQIQRVRIIASARRHCSFMHEHTCQFDIEKDRTEEVCLNDLGEIGVKGDLDAQPYAHRADQEDLAGDVAGQFLLVAAALGLQEVVLKADLLAVLRRDLNAEVGDHRRLADQFNFEAKGLKTIDEIFLDIQQRHNEQILICVFGCSQADHASHQIMGRLFVIVAVHCRSVGLDNLLQRGLCHFDDIRTFAGDHLEFQAHVGLGIEYNGHIHPQESAIRIDIQRQLLLKVHLRGDRGNLALHI